MSVMHVQSCCFSCKTYCFYDVSVAVRVVGLNLKKKRLLAV